MRVSRWMMVAVACTLSGLGTVGTTGTTHAATLTVCASGCQYTQIQSAVNAATSGDTITIGPGTYTGGLAIGTSGLTLAGAGVTKTAIQGEEGPAVNIEPHATVTIRDLTISRGNASFGGGGISDYGTLTLDSVTVSDNSANTGGGVYVASGASLTGTGVAISNNTTGGQGGGISNAGGTVALTSSTISGNSGGEGGGIYNLGTVTLTPSTISSNSGGEGGGIANGGTVTLTSSTITGNSAMVDGGGILNDGGTISLTSSTISGNTAYEGGGGIWTFLGTVSLTNTSITGNTPDNCYGVTCGVAAPGPSPPPVEAAPFVFRRPGSLSAGFYVTFSSRAPGQGYVLFGPGPGCTGLVETATQDRGAGTTHHLVRVTGDDMNLGAGAVVPGVTYSFEVETVTATGVERHTNGGKCYTVTIPSS